MEGGVSVACHCEDGTALPLATRLDFAKSWTIIADGVLDDSASSLSWSLAGAGGFVQLGSWFWEMRRYETRFQHELDISTINYTECEAQMLLWREWGRYSGYGCSFCHRSKA